MAYERVNWENLPSTKTPINQTNLNKMENAIDQNANNIGGKEYDNTSTYDVGDIVKYQGQLYICTTAITTAEAWNSNHWQATDVLSSAEVVDTLSGNEANRAPSVRAVNQAIPQLTRKTYTTTATANSAVTPYNGYVFVDISTDKEQYGEVLSVYASDEYGVAVPCTYVKFNGTMDRIAASCNLSAPRIKFYVTYLKYN